MDIDPYAAPNPYDDGERDRFFMWANEDEMVVHLIGRGVLVGEHKVEKGTVLPQNEHMVGKKDMLFMLDGGGHAWYHEVMGNFSYEKNTAAFTKWLGTRRVIKVPPQHQTAVAV